MKTSQEIIGEKCIRDDNGVLSVRNENVNTSKLLREAVRDKLTCNKYNLYLGDVTMLII